MGIGTDSGQSTFIGWNPPQGEHAGASRAAGTQSAVMPASLTTLAQSATSDLMMSANCACGALFGSHPAISSFSRTSGVASAASSLLLMRSTIGPGVPAGTTTPNHGVTCASAKPCSAMVGTSGKYFERPSLTAPMIRMAPLTAQLIDATTGIHLWSDRFEGDLENIFELQDRVASGVVGAIDPKLLEAEIARVKREAPANYDAYDCFLRASALIHQWNTEGREEALRLFYRAIELDPDYGQTYAFATECHCWRKVDGLATDPDHEPRTRAPLPAAAI